MAERDQEESTSDKNLRIYGTRIPNVEQKRKVDAYLKAADEAYMRGGSEPVKDGLDELGNPVSTAGMSDSDAFFAKGRAKDKQQLGGYKSFGDKSRADTINSIRALQGRAPKAFVPDEFDRLLDTSVTFADKSALHTEKGRQEAVRQGVGAGLSAKDAINKVQEAYDLLKKFSGKQDGGQPTTPNQTTQPTTTTTTDTTKTPETPTVEVEKTPTAKSPLGEFVSGDEESGGGSAFRGVVRGSRAGSVLYKNLQDKVGEAKNIVDEYNKSGGKLVDQGKLTGAADDAARAYGEAADKMTKFEEKWKGKAPAAGSPAERAAVKQFNDLKDTLEAAEAAKGSTTKAAQEAAETAAQAAKAEGVAGGLGSKIVAAGEALGKFAKPLKPLAPVARIAGKVAGPVFEAYDAYKYFSGDEDQKAKYAESAATLGDRLFTPESLSEFGGAVGDVLSPTKNVLGVVEAGRQWNRSTENARASEAAADTAQKLFNARLGARRQDYSDEEFDKLSVKDRVAYMKKLREKVKVAE
jgi:hypothetical protein